MDSQVPIRNMSDTTLEENRTQSSQSQTIPLGITQMQRQTTDEPNRTDPTLPLTNQDEMMEIVYQINSVAYTYLMPVLIVAGVITNIINMYVLRDLSRVKERRHKGSTTTYLYLNWLAFAQLLACLSIIPSLVHLYRDALTYPWAVYFAHFEIGLINSLTSSCVYIVVGLSVDRFVAVCKPHSYRALNRARLAAIRIAASFLIPPIFYTPLGFFQIIVESDGGYTTSDNIKMTSNVIWRFWMVAVELCHRLIPASAIVILNLSIIWRCRQLKQNHCRGSKRTLRSEDSSTDGRLTVGSNKSGKSQTIDQDSRLFALLLGVMVVFLTTTLPSATLGLTDTFGYKYESIGFEIFRAVANLLEVLGFSFNFFLYFFLVPEVKTKLFAMCPKKKAKVYSGGRKL